MAASAGECAWSVVLLQVGLQSLFQHHEVSHVPRESKDQLVLISLISKQYSVFVASTFRALFSLLSDGYQDMPLSLFVGSPVVPVTIITELIVNWSPIT